MTFYVTTAIPYVNAPPHLGHALELVQADVLARHRRLRGEPVRFLTGTDDNALKNVTAARAAGAEVGAFVRANADRFAALREPLELSFDDFIRTGSDPRHARGVAALWRRSAPDFYRHGYTGLYCAGCEQFLDGDRCEEHPAAPERVAETNWFFRLSRYQAAIRDALESGRVRVEPPARRNEVLAFVRSGLRDISVSRPAARADGWGIPVPGDPDQVVYVWWDALANYVTALGDGDDLRTWWLGAGERVHVIGKGIVRFHAVHWLALLLSAGLPLPTTILVHDYLTVAGAKLAKSAGNAVDPVALAGRYGVDALRWWLLSEPAPAADPDFTVGRLVARADRDLANGVGNLVNRTLTLARRQGTVRPAAVESSLPHRIDAALRTGDFRAATAALAAEVDRGNRLLDATRPWRLAEPGPVLAEALGICQVLAGELRPFLPSGADRLRAQLRGDGPPRPVFPRLSG
ncbi:methionine--tRNA ligase [Amorphoplanes nipponensis]|uniref:methionine--tRNA ligase n=1 Tax=Actinoplanes nipponensis TaxID=135950 RepID=A0A919JNR2_9ACTN|nr:methionine--tRNA ligase [Actinoplanes nipponensis]GIE53003.1 methionine--tRNA ligase [Actinoplanes nipponensis]